MRIHVYKVYITVTNRSLLTLNNLFIVFSTQEASLVLNVGQCWTGSGTREISRGREGSGRKRENSGQTKEVEFRELGSQW